MKQHFSWNFRIKDTNDFSQFGRTERNPRLCHQSIQIINYFTRSAEANQLSRGPPSHCTSSSVADKSHFHTRIAQSVVFKIIFQDLIRWTEMFGCLSPVGRFPSVRANKVPNRQFPSEIKIFWAATLELVLNSWQDHRKSVNAFSEISKYPMYFLVEL